MVGQLLAQFLDNAPIDTILHGNFRVARVVKRNAAQGRACHRIPRQEIRLAEFHSSKTLGIKISAQTPIRATVLSTLLHHITLSSALFLLVLLGYLLMRVGKWSKDVAGALSKFVFNIAVPALLFDTMSRFSSLPPVDTRLLIAFSAAASSFSSSDAC